MSVAERVVTDETTKACPVCGETIKAIALKCRFCNTDLVAFTEKKQLEAEKDLFSGHPAVFYRVEQYAAFVVMVALAAVVVLGAESGLSILYTLLFFSCSCGIIYLYYYLQSRGTTYRITTQRIKLERGVLSKTQESLEIFRIDHFELRKPLGMRLMGQARLHLFSSDAEFETFSIYAVPALEHLAETLRECQLRERTRRGLTTFVKA